MAHEGLWEQLGKLDGRKTAKNAGCRFLSNPDRYVLTMLNTEYEVNPANAGIFVVGDASPAKIAGFIEQLCILAYLIGAKDIPPANKLEGLIRASERFDAEKCEFGDASIKLNALPRIPLTFVIWRGDDEFEARA